MRKCANCGEDTDPRAPNRGMCACTRLPDGGTEEELESCHGEDLDIS